MPFPSSPTNGQTATVNGITYTYSSTSNSWTRLGSLIVVTTSSQVQTSARTANSAHYITFVDSDNSSATGELVYTTSSFTVNPSTGNIGIGNAAPTAKLDVTGSIKSTVYRETRAIISASDIDVSSGNYFSKTISGTTTFTVSNVPSITGTVASFILDLTNGGSSTINWWTNTKWPGGTQPTLTTSGRDVLGFFTYDGGTTWTGLLLGRDVK